MSDEYDADGWWVIAAPEFMRALRLAANGADPDLIYAEFYANSTIDASPAPNGDQP